jgi:hypothetical protein
MKRSLARFVRCHALHFSLLYCNGNSDITLCWVICPCVHLTSQLSVEHSESVIRNIELQLVRVETVGTSCTMLAPSSATRFPMCYII